jgi:hypothetical protein
MPCDAMPRNGGRTQHRLQYLSAFGPDRRFALDSRLGGADGYGSWLRRLCGKPNVHSKPLSSDICVDTWSP